MLSQVSVNITSSHQVLISSKYSSQLFTAFFKRRRGNTTVRICETHEELTPTSIVPGRIINEKNYKNGDRKNTNSDCDSSVYLRLATIRLNDNHFAPNYGACVCQFQKRENVRIQIFGHRKKEREIIFFLTVRRKADILYGGPINQRQTSLLIIYIYIYILMHQIFRSGSYIWAITMSMSSWKRKKSYRENGREREK